MPANDGLRLDDRQGLPDIGKHSRKYNEYQPVKSIEAESLRGSSAQYDDLLPQHQDFGFKRCSRSE